MAERLSAVQVNKVYPGGAHAVRDVSFSVEPGTFLVLLGPSGSGKTTLLRTIAGIERASSGTITIGSRVVAGPGGGGGGREGGGGAPAGVHRPPEQRDLSMVFQDYALWPHLTVTDNVGFALRRRGHARSECRRLARIMLERVGLENLADRYPGQLSGGEQQRVALARALAGDTGLLLCDEPLSNLDADLRERMRVEIASLVRDVGATTLYITHDQQEAFALADQVGVMSGGRLVQLGSPEVLYATPASRFVARFTGLAGELPVRLEGAAAPRGTVAVTPLAGVGGGGAEAGAAAGVAAHPPVVACIGLGAPSRGPAVMTIRPGAVSICAASEPSAQLLGRISDVAFRGRSYEVAIDLVGGGRLTGIQSDRRIDRGSEVGLQLDHAGCVVFSDQEPASDAATVETVAMDTVLPPLVIGTPA
jgi:iron(III) transport system ATP-binding protein